MAGEVDTHADARLKTGIAGLDEMLFGGIPMQNQVVIAGGPGSGKSLLCFEVLYNCARSGVPAAFITFEDRPEDVLKNAKEAFRDFGDIDGLVDDGMLNVCEEGLPIKAIDREKDSMTSFGKIISDMEGMIRDTKARCVALDSISLLQLVFPGTNTLSYRRSIVSLTASLRKMGVTALLTTEMSYADMDREGFSPEFFVFDGIISLQKNSKSDRREFGMEIIKMRGTNHSTAFAPYEITPSGFKVKPSPVGV